MKLIVLTRGKLAKVDDEDFEELNRFNWGVNHWGYVRRNLWEPITGRRYTEWMSRVVMKAPSHLFVDHKFHNKLDHRKENLRLATCSQNNANRIYVLHSSRFKGVHWSNSKNCWIAKIKCNRRSIYIGSYRSEIEAAIAYRIKAKRLFGEFVCA